MNIDFGNPLLCDLETGVRDDPDCPVNGHLVYLLPEQGQTLKHQLFHPIPFALPAGVLSLSPEIKT